MGIVDGEIFFFCLCAHVSTRLFICKNPEKKIIREFFSISFSDGTFKD